MAAVTPPPPPANRPGTKRLKYEVHCVPSGVVEVLLRRRAECGPVRGISVRYGY